MSGSIQGIGMITNPQFSGQPVQRAAPPRFAGESESLVRLQIDGDAVRLFMPERRQIPLSGRHLLVSHGLSADGVKPVHGRETADIREVEYLA